MGLPAATALCIFGTLVLATASRDSDLQVGLFPPCSATLAPEGPCEREGDGCPFVVNLPPMTVNLPKQLMDLERLVEELQMLKNNVDELRKMCKDCSASQAEKECTQEPKQDADDGDFDINRQIWENNKRVVNEDRRKDGKSPKDKTEQVVAAGKNVRISERRKVDRKQIDRALDKQNSPLGNATTHMRNQTTGKSQVWGDQMMDSKRQTEAADETEDGGVKLRKGNEESGRQELHDKAILDEKNYSKKTNYQTKDEEDIMKNKENIKPSSPDNTDRHIWSDKHHKASHEEGAEKNFSSMDKSAEQSIDRDRPVWRDKTRVDTNQMERIEERGGKTSDASKEGKNAPKSSMQSGYHVWLDETMETSSAERIKMSGRSGGGDMGQDHRANGEADRSLKGNEEKLRDFENRELMEGTDLRSGVVNSSPSHEFIDLDWSVTLTSPPTFTASHVTTDVKQGQNNGRGSSNEQFKIDGELAVGGDGESFENGGVANVEDGQLEWPVLEIQSGYDERKVGIDERYRPIKIATAMPLDTRSNSDFSTDLKTVTQNSKVRSKNASTNVEQTNHNKQFTKRVKQPSKIANKLNTTRSTTSDSHLSRDVIQGERKITSRLPLQTTKEKYINTKDSNLDESSSHTISGKDSKIVNPNHRETKILRTVPTKVDSDTTTSPTAGNGHFLTDVKTGRPKTASGQPSRNNQGKNNSSTMDSSLDKPLNKILGKHSKTYLTINTSDTTRSNSNSHFTYFKPEDTEGNEPPSHSFDEITITSTPKLSTSHLTKEIKNGDKKANYNNPPQKNPNERASNPMSLSNDKHLSKTKNLFTELAITAASTSSTPTSSNSHLGRRVIQGERKITSRLPSQTTPEKDIKTENSNLDFKSSTHTVSGKDSKILNSNHRETKILKTVLTEDSSDTITSPTAKNGHFITDVKTGRPKTAFGQPSQHNQGENDRGTMDTSLDKEFNKISSEDSKSELTINTSDTTSSASSTPTSSDSHLGSDANQSEQKITSRPPAQTTPEKDIKTEVSNLDVLSSTNTMSGKDSKIVSSNHHKTNISKTVPTKGGSNTATSPAAGNGYFITDVKSGRPKSASGQPSRNNQGKNYSGTMDTNLDKELNKLLSEDSKSELPISTSVDSSNSNTPEKDITTQDLNLDAKSSTHTISGKDIKIVNSHHHDIKISKTVLSTATSPIAGNAHFITNVKPGTTKTTFESSENNQDKGDTDTMDASLDEQLTKILSEDSISELTKTNAKYENMEEGNEPPTQGNYNKMDNKTEHSSSNRPFYQPSFDEITTTTTPKLSKSDFTKAIKHGDKKETYTPPKNNPNEKASNPVSSSVNTQLSKTKIQLTMVAITEASTSSTPTSSNSHLGRDIKPQQQLPDYKDRIQSNQVDNTHLNHDVQLDKMKAKNEQYVSISTPTTSKFEHSIFNGQLSQSNYNERDSENKHSSLGAPLVKATSKPITVNDSIASNSEMTTSIEKGRKESNEDISSASSISTDLEKEPSGFDVSAKVNIVQPIANKLAEDTTISTPTAFKPHFDQNSNQGQQETKQKTNYGQLSTNYNEKDINSIQDAHMDTPTSQPASVLVDDISNSTLRRDASFKDLTSTTFTPHHISPTTTAPLQKDNRKDNRKISSSKIVPNQRPKPSIGMKPEANLKLKNPKNDRKPDHTPSPDTQVKNDQRRMHSKVTPGRAPWPAQTPSKSDQSTLLQVNVKNNPLPSATPIQKASTPTLAPSMAGVLTDDRKRPNVTSLHDSRQTMHSEIDKVSRMKQFIKKTGNMKNNTSKVMLAQNKSSEVNGTKEGSKTSPALNLKIPQINQKPKPQVPIVKSANPKLESSRKVKVEQALKDKIPKINTFVDLKNSSKVSPGLKPPNKPVKPKVIPASKIKPQLKEKEKNAKMDVKPTSGPIKLTTLNWETARDLAVDPLHQNTTTLESLTMNPNRGVISSSQTTEPIPSIALTTEPNIATQVSTTLPTKSDFNVGENSPSFPPRVQQLSPTVRAVFRSTAPPAPHPGPKATAVENTTPSARELRVKINQVAAFLNKSSQQQPHSRPLDEGPGDHTEVGEKTDEKPDAEVIQPYTKKTTPEEQINLICFKVNDDMMVARDCSDHVLRGHTKSGLYLVTPDPSGGSVHVLCDMEESGGGWTVLQRRHDGSVSFNRSWAEYRDGFGLLNGGEFWLGNNLIHLLTRDRSMELRVELEDFEGVREYALYQLFKVASERMRYRLTVDGYSGTAGDALRFNTKYNHNSRAFTTPDRDNDRYPSGNCGTYYSSGWWFDACMAANLNGRYYKGRYKGVRDGIYWGTWHNISTEYYPTNERLSFKTVRMMIRPKGFKP